jgi:hypothetical protein
MRSCRIQVETCLSKEERKAKRTPRQPRRCSQLAQCSRQCCHLLCASPNQQRLPHFQAVVSRNRGLLDMRHAEG